MDKSAARRLPNGARLEVHFSTCHLHLLGTVHTEDVYVLRCSDALTATGANIFPGAAGLLGFRVISTELTGAADCQLVSPLLGGTETLESGGRLSDRKAYLLIIVNEQSPLFRLLLEPLVMVCTAPVGGSVPLFLI